MFNYDDLKKTILDLRKAHVPAVVVEADQLSALEILEEQVIDICNEIGLQVICERSDFQLKIRNLYFSNN